MTRTANHTGPADRLDRALAQLVPGLSRTEARRLIAAGAVFLDGRRCQVASRLVREGTRIQVEDAARAPSPSPSVLRILHQDEACIAVDKPPGMPAVPTRRSAAGSAQTELGQQLRAREGRRAELWPVHRIDRETSGILLFARSRDAARRLGEAFAGRRVEKEYLAWVEGTVEADEGVVAAALRAEGRRAVVDDTGKAAETRWRVEERRHDRTLLRLNPVTGRMHQIRAHMRAIGHPVLGDRLYGGAVARRLMLHATRLRFPHPATGEAIEIQSPAVWPADGEDP